MASESGSTARNICDAGSCRKTFNSEKDGVAVVAVDVELLSNEHEDEEDSSPTDPVQWRPHESMTG